MFCHSFPILCHQSTVETGDFDVSPYSSITRWLTSSLAFLLPNSFSTIASANSMAVPGPLLVTSSPSMTTLPSTAVWSFSLSVNPGWQVAFLPCKPNKTPLANQQMSFNTTMTGALIKDVAQCICSSSSPVTSHGTAALQQVLHKLLHAPALLQLDLSTCSTKFLTSATAQHLAFLPAHIMYWIVQSWAIALEKSTHDRRPR